MHRKINVKIKAPYHIEQALHGDVGFDVRASEKTYIFPMETKTISTGVYVELPEGVECQVRPKSGLSSKGLLVHFGTVDTGYRGEIGVTVTNLTDKNYVFNEWDKVAQLLFKKYDPVILEVVDEIDTNTHRKDKGFGSTGK